METNKQKRSFFKRLRAHYRLVILDDDSLEETFSLKLTPLAIINLFGLSLILFTTIIVSLIFFTALKEYIPGYSDSGMRKTLIALNLRSDSLVIELEQKTRYINNLNDIISGKIGKNDMQTTDSSSTFSIQKNQPAIQPKKIIAEDSILRAEIENAERYALSGNTENHKRDNISDVFFFPPLKGTISHSFNLKENHPGTDIVSKQNEAIKATLDGTVIAAFWNPQTGHVIQLQHSNNLISIYKHNSVLLKKEGDRVNAGDPIAIIGNSGELSSGPHLHFELWFNGQAVNAQEYINF